MVQTAEGALTEVHSMLQRVRELAVEAANSTLSSSDAASVSTEITALRAEINRIAGATMFNGQYLLTGALSVAQDTGAAGSLVVGTALNTGHTASMAAIDVSGARANTTYTITSQAGGKVTLSDGVNSQQVTLTATIGATGTMTVNFGNMGVKLTVVGDAAKTAADLATDLAANGAVTTAIAGASGTDLVDGDFLNSNNTVTAGGSVTYSTPTHPHGLSNPGGATPLTATGSAGLQAGTTSSLSTDGSGNVTFTLGTENFAGTLAAPSAGAHSTAVMTGDQGHTITLAYVQDPTAPVMADMDYDVMSSRFTFVASGSGATVANLTSSPTAVAGTYSFSSSALGQITLTGPGGSQTLAVADTAANTTQTLNFNTLGISFELQGNALGAFSRESAIGNLTDPANDTIVVTSSGGGATNNAITTGTGSGANFQVGANASDALGVSFADARTSATGYGSLDSAISAFETATGTGSGIVAAAQALITATDGAIGYVSTTRGNLGAVQNRLEHTTSAISIASENLSASGSRIRDLDVASEMVHFTKTQILQQAGTAILAQANSASQSVLTLLR
jgi:flagellin